jgi:hypothetical protein
MILSLEHFTPGDYSYVRSTAQHTHERFGGMTPWHCGFAARILEQATQSSMKMALYFWRSYQQIDGS